MYRSLLARLLLFSASATFFLVSTLCATAQLQVTYGASGIDTVKYDRVPLADNTLHPEDALHIWHMKLTDMQGKVLSDKNHGWGENNLDKKWDPSKHAWTYHFVWGYIQVQYLQSGNKLSIVVTEKNAASSGVILDGASIYPLTLHFPSMPDGFEDGRAPDLADNVSKPSVTAATFSSMKVISFVSDAQRPLYNGFVPSQQHLSFSSLISSTSPDGLATFRSNFDRPVRPGETDTFKVSLVFASSETSTASIAQEVYRNWTKTWPMKISWNDRRPIGTVYLASSPEPGNLNREGNSHRNPRHYFINSGAISSDITTEAGIGAFQMRVLRQAEDNARNLKRLGAQGAITWDIEGEQYPQSTSYVCAPDAIAVVSPEMESIITNKASAYKGMKLDDAYFKIMTAAGFRVGVCVRPQHFGINANGIAQQSFLPGDKALSELERKIRYAHDRWGATLFYIDSSVSADGAPLEVSIIEKLAATFPDSLLIPEESTDIYHAYSAPFRSFLFHHEVGTSKDVYSYYPRAFSVNLINDVNPSLLQTNLNVLQKSVKMGDILMGHVDYWHPNNTTILSLYKASVK